MQNQENVLEAGTMLEVESENSEYVISLNKFILLSVLTIGIYELWWMYKIWRYYKQKENLDIMPAARAIFSIFFLYGLMNKILGYAEEKGYSKTYNPTTLFIGFIVANLASRLPDPFWLVSLATVFCFIGPVNAFNYSVTGKYEVENKPFSGRQIGLMIVGAIFWVLVFYGMTIPE
jgi:hypothetical protein